MGIWANHILLYYPKLPTTEHQDQCIAETKAKLGRVSFGILIRNQLIPNVQTVLGCDECNLPPSNVETRCGGAGKRAWWSTTPVVTNRSDDFFEARQMDDGSSPCSLSNSPPQPFIAHLEWGKNSWDGDEDWGGGEEAAFIKSSIAHR